MCLFESCDVTRVKQNKKAMRTIHIMLNVRDLNKAKTFYENLLGAKATKVKDDYVQWKTNNPQLNLSISSDPDQPFGVNHLGIQTDNEEDLEQLYQQAGQADATLAEEGHTTCCYAISQKSWAKDHDGTEWELFLTYEDSPSYYEAASLLK